jgi:hypothetical protein
MTKLPTRSATLAEKAEKRGKKLIFRRKLAGLFPQWWMGTGEIVGVAVLGMIGFFLLMGFLMGFFGQEDQVNFFSAPLIPVLAEVTSFLMPYSYGVRFWLLVFLGFFPLAFYFWVREVTGRRLSAFIAALIATLPTGIFLSLRVKLGLLAEDGGQVASLTLTSLACLFLLRFLRGGSFRMAVFTGLGICLVALISPLGLFILFCFALAMLGSEMLLSQARLKLMRFITVFAMAGGLVAFWYHPGFVFLLLDSNQVGLVGKTLTNLLPLSFFLLPLLGAAGFLLFEDKPQLQPLFLAIFLTIGFSLLALGAGLGLTTPSRFMPALGIAVAWLIGVLLARFIDFWQNSARLDKNKLLRRYRRKAMVILGVLLFILLLMMVKTFHWNMEKIEQAQVQGVSTFRRTGIWELRRESGGAMRFLGFGISTMTLGTIGFLGINLKPSQMRERRESRI